MFVFSLAENDSHANMQPESGIYTTHIGYVLGLDAMGDTGIWDGSVENLY